jgi:hypothetical protein
MKTKKILSWLNRELSNQQIDLKQSEGFDVIEKSPTIHPTWKLQKWMHKKP